MNSTKTFCIALLTITTSAFAGCSESPVPNAGADEARSGSRSAADLGFGDLAFSTYRGGNDKLVFVSDTKVKKTWKNMVAARSTEPTKRLAATSL